MAWYDDEGSLTHVAIYKNPGDASKEADKAARKGWMPQGTAATDGHVNVGRTTLKVLALGVPFLITGASRTKGNLTLTFVRTPEWLAAKQARTTKVSAAPATTSNSAQNKPRAALQASTIGHVVQDVPYLAKPDLFGVAAGTVVSGSSFEIVELRGSFAYVRLSDGSMCWLRTDSIEPGPFVPPASPEPTEKTCPRCAEAVKAAAQVCRFCGYEFTAAPGK